MINRVTNVNKYYLVAAEIIWTPSVLNTIDIVTEVDITVGNIPYLEIIPVGPNERVCNSFEGFLVPLSLCG